MNSLLVFAAHNTLFALALALMVYGLTHVWRNPPLAHVLWLLVLLKLVAPPIIHVDWMALRRHQISGGVSHTGGQQANGRPGRVRQSTRQWTELPSSAGSQRHGFADGVRLAWMRVQPFVLWLWFGGAAIAALVALTRIVRFERLLRDTLPASVRLRRLTGAIADKIGVGRVPDVRYGEFADVPLVWCSGRRPKIVLPTRLVRQLDEEQLEMILAHEVAHLRRRDHWVRVVELIVSTVYWWNPLVWVIRRQMHQAEDLCCDAWVRWSIPGCTKSYAEVVLKTAESLGASQRSAQLLLASPFQRSLSLKARIEMILESQFAPQVTRKSMLVATLLALLILPAFFQVMTTKALADTKDGAQAAPARKTDAAGESPFPYAVQFEQGATSFEDGDSITILEVRGTAETFVPGNIYWIRGTYALASHNDAMLAAYTTARNAVDGTSSSLKVQTKQVKPGNGTFTLFLPMSCEGWPHVSFYSGGPSIGGNYFGTGDSVLRKWWGTD